jgi:hypothetical protein
MPNQRAKTKTYLGGFVEREFRDKISQLAREAGMGHNAFGFALRLIQGPLNRRRVARAAAALINRPRTASAAALPNSARLMGPGSAAITAAQRASVYAASPKPMNLI